MRVREATEFGFPDAAAWDRMVAQDARGHLLQTWAWGELKGAFGWVPARLAVERDGVLVAGAQVLYRAIGPLRLAYIPKGPVLLEQDAAETLWQVIHAHCRRMHAIALKVEPEYRYEDVEQIPWLASPGWKASSENIQPRRTIIVNINVREEEILARMKPKWRYNIRLSERKGVIVRMGGVEDLGEFYALMRVTSARDAFGIHSSGYYRRALELFAPLGRAALFMAEYQGQALAGLMVFAFNGRAYYMYGASSDEHRELMPNHQLQWRAMCWAKSQGCSQYDLWGIPDGDEGSSNTALAGVGRFKSGFGGEVVRYAGAFDYVYMRPLYWLINRAWAYRRARSAASSRTPNSA